METLDQSKLTARLGHLDQRALKFSYKKPVDVVENAYEGNRKDFLSK